MINYQIVNILQDLLGKSYPNTKENHIFNCPSCNYHTQKLSICVQIDSLHYGSYNCWVCGFKGKNLYSLLKFLNIDRNSKIYEQINRYYKIQQTKKSNNYINHKQTLSLPKGSQLLYPFQNKMIFKRAYKYLNSRGINILDIIKYRLYICNQGKYKDRIIIPSYDINFKLNYFVSRSINPYQTLRYLNPSWSKDIIFNQYMINFQYPIILCQGVFDAIAYKRNSIPLLGKNIPQKLKVQIIKNKPNVYISLDLDAINQSYKLAKQLSQYGVKCFIVKIEQKDPGSLTLDELQQYIKNANLFNKYSKQEQMKYLLNKI